MKALKAKKNFNLTGGQQAPCSQLLELLNFNNTLAFVIDKKSLEILWKNKHVSQYPTLFEYAVRSIYTQSNNKSKYRLKPCAGILTNDNKNLSIYLYHPLANDDKLSLCLVINLSHCIQQPRHLVFIQEYCQKLLSCQQYESLTARQKQVLKLILNNNSRRDIGEQLNLSVHTIQDHNKALFKKFTCNSISQLRQKAKSLNLV